METEKTKEKLQITNNMPNSIKSIMDIIKGTWGYFMTGVAIVTFIWTLGVKSERSSLDNATIKTDISILKENIKKLDTITISIEEIKKSQNEIIESQNAIRNSYVKYLINNQSLSKKDFIDYMEGLQFQISPLQSTIPIKPNINSSKEDTIEMKIAVKPLKK